MLAEKLTGLDPDARDVLLLTGELSGFEVAPSAHVAVYGALPATIVSSPGTSVRAGLIMATAAQFEALTLTEFNYRLARIDGSPFAPDLDVNTNLLGGYLDAFVEVDLLLWSHRWSIELFRYAGFQVDDVRHDFKNQTIFAKPLSTH